MQKTVIMIAIGFAILAVTLPWVRVEASEKFEWRDEYTLDIATDLRNPNKSVHWSLHHLSKYDYPNPLPEMIQVEIVRLAKGGDLDAVRGLKELPIYPTNDPIQIAVDLIAENKRLWAAEEAVELLLAVVDIREIDATERREIVEKLKTTLRSYTSKKEGKTERIEGFTFIVDDFLESIGKLGDPSDLETIVEMGETAMYSGRIAALEAILEICKRHPDRAQHCLKLIEKRFKLKVGVGEKKNLKRDVEEELKKLVNENQQTAFFDMRKYEHSLRLLRGAQRHELDPINACSPAH